MHKQILPEELGAATALGGRIVPEAASYQVLATNAFAKGEIQFDELLHLIIAKLDAEPPPTKPNPNDSLEQILAMLEDEKKACEKLGVPCRPLNVALLKDWMKPSSCSNPGDAQARAAQQQARAAKAKAEKAGKEAKLLVEKTIEQVPATHERAGKSARNRLPLPGTLWSRSWVTTCGKAATTFRRSNTARLSNNTSARLPRSRPRRPRLQLIERSL